MAVTVRLPGVLAEHAGGLRMLQVATGDGGTVGDLLDVLAGAHPSLERRIRDEAGVLRRHVNVFVDSTDARAIGGLAAPVPDGAEVDVLPAVSGG